METPLIFRGRHVAEILLPIDHLGKLHVEDGEEADSGPGDKNVDGQEEVDALLDDEDCTCMEVDVNDAALRAQVVVELLVAEGSMKDGIGKVVDIAQVDTVAEDIVVEDIATVDTGAEGIVRVVVVQEVLDEQMLQSLDCTDHQPIVLFAVLAVGLA